MSSISKPDHCAERPSLVLLSAHQEYLMTFKLMTSQVVQRARPLSGHIWPLGRQRVKHRIFIVVWRCVWQTHSRKYCWTLIVPYSYFNARLLRPRGKVYYDRFIMIWRTLLVKPCFTVKIVMQYVDFSTFIITIALRCWKNMENFRITEQLNIKDYGNNSKIVGKCCSNRETSGTFGRPSGDFRRVFRHCRELHSYNVKISRRLQIFVPWGLAGIMMMNDQHYIFFIKFVLVDTLYLVEWASRIHSEFILY